MRYQLRDYQIRGEAQTRDALLSIKDGQRSAVLQSPTGSGKTVIGCSFMEKGEAKGARSLFVAPRIELVDQTCEKLDEIGVRYGVIRGQDPRLDLRAPIQVGSVQTVALRLHRLDMDFDFVLFDESHHAVSDMYLKILHALPPRCIVLGLTATAFRTDGKGLGRVFKRLIRVATVLELLENDYLVWPRVFREEVNRKGLHSRAGEFIQSEASARMNKPKLVGHVVKEWERNAEGLLTIGFAHDVEHSMAIVEAFKAAGVPAEHVDGSMPQAQQKAALDRLRRRETIVVINCQLYIEGLDVPQLECMIDAQMTKSLLRDRQKKGRILRPSPGKTEAIILDHAGNTTAHGYVHEEPDVSLDDAFVVERPRPTKRCRACGALYSGAPERCPQCLKLLRDPSTQRRADDDLPGLRDDGHVLVEDDRAPAPKKPRQMPRWLAEKKYREDLKLADERGYKAGWAAKNFKRRTGEWPTPEMEDGSPIRTAVVTRDGKKERIRL